MMARIDPPGKARERISVRRVRCKTIVNRTAGFLDAYTHSINPYQGCTLGGSLCGMPDYAPEIVKSFGETRAWGLYLDVKENAPEVYAADHDRIRRSHAPAMRIYMASVTDPYVPQEKEYRITRGILEAMRHRPPDLLTLQTHTPNVLRDLDLLADLSRLFPIVVQVSVETDRESFPVPIPRHGYSIASRLHALAKLRERGIATVGVVSPLWPVDDADSFARRLDACCDRVILDHYLLGDGSRNGARTCARVAIDGLTFPALLAATGFSEWTTLAPFERVREAFVRILGLERVGISKEGFARAARLR